MADKTASGDFAWYPSDAFKRASNWSAFIAAEGLVDYAALEYKAAHDPKWFWDALVRFLGVQFTKPYTRVLDQSKGIEWPQWCVGATGNMTLSLIDRHLAAGRGGYDAIVGEGEDGSSRRLTYRELATEVNRLASGLAATGLKSGDAVGVHLPMIPEVAVAFLALARLGCIVLPLFSGFGAAAITTRLNEAEAVAVITADGSLRRGKPVEMKRVLDEAIRDVPTLRHVVVARRLGTDVSMQGARDAWWSDVTARGRDDFAAVELPAEHPLMIVYTSGTTGRPKGTVHTHCGVTVKTGEDFILCFDLKPTDRLMWMTDFGWLVGPLQVTAALLAGATCVLAEGTPDYPETGRLWRLVQDHKISFLGCGPTLARMMMRYGNSDISKYDLSSLRVVASTGEPWDPDSWMWVYENALRRRGPLMNYSGGTELGGIVATNVLFPIKPASFSGPIPGTGADIVDAEGHSVGAGDGRRAGHAAGLHRHDPWPLARSATLHRQLLEPLPRHMDTRRLGLARRRRLMVHPWPLRRHHQDRREAHRPGRNRIVAARNTPGQRRRRGGGAGSNQGIGGHLHGHRGTARDARGCPRIYFVQCYRQRSRRLIPAETSPVRARPSAHPQHENYAPGDPRRAAQRETRRSVCVGQSRSRRRTATDRGRADQPRR